MVTEAIILSIDFNANSCVVRIPLFETANTVENFTATAKFAIQPGIYNGYNIGDTVWVSFITDKKETPLVIGKIYQGSDIEKEVKGGAIAAAKLKVSDYATLPEGTQIDTSYANFDTIKKIIENIKNIQENIDGENNSMDIYSEDEQQIGYWVDGKALYRKTFIRNINVTGPNTISEIFDLSDLNYDLLWVDTGNTFLIGETYSTGCYYVQPDDRFYTYIIEDSKQLVASGIPVSGNKIIKIAITIRYTKK